MALTRQVNEETGEVFFLDTESGGTVPADPSQAGATSWADVIAKGLTTVQTFQLNQINVQRARMGLPPIDVSAYGTGVRVGLAPQTQQLVIYGGLALLAVMVFQTVMKRR